MVPCVNIILILREGVGEVRAGVWEGGRERIKREKQSLRCVNFKT